MSTYGPPGQGQPEDPTSEPRSTPPGYPPPGGYPPPPPAEGYPPPGGYPPPPPVEGYPPPGEYPATREFGVPDGGYPPPPGAPQPPAYGQQPGGYGAPPNPYGQQPPGGYGPGGYGPGGFGPGLPPAPPKRRSGLKIALIIGGVVLLLLCSCVGLAIWGLANYDSSDPDPDPGPGPIGAPTPRSSASADPLPSRTSARPDPGGQVFVPGDCLVNDGTDSAPDLRKVPCGPDTYEVLARIPFTTDETQCESRAPEHDANYVHDNNLDFADYVLCLKQQ